MEFSVTAEFPGLSACAQSSHRENEPHGSGPLTRLRRFLRDLGSREERRFEAIQIEVTSHCNLRCVTCPVAALTDRWNAQHLAWEAFVRIARAFRHIKYVHLQGWGEPLLHPRLFDMIKVSKDAGCRVGFTTNGTLLDLASAQRLLDLGLDLLAVSIAGVTQPTHGSIRVGSDLARILENLRGFLALRDDRQSLKPKVEIFFLMTKMNVAELPGAAELAASLRADELVATNLDYIPTRDQDMLKAFGDPSFQDACVGFVESARAKIKAGGASFRAYPLAPEEVTVCEANPLKILFVSADGWVLPCTYLGLAGQTKIPRIFDGNAIRVARPRFGHIMEQELLEIWESPAYRDFRQQFVARRTASVVSAVATVTGSASATRVDLPAAPEPCRSCAKLFGV